MTFNTIIRLIQTSLLRKGVKERLNETFHLFLYLPIPRYSIDKIVREKNHTNRTNYKQPNIRTLQRHFSKKFLHHSIYFGTNSFSHIILFQSNLVGVQSVGFYSQCIVRLKLCTRGHGHQKAYEEENIF